MIFSKKVLCIILMLFFICTLSGNILGESGRLYIKCVDTVKDPDTNKKKYRLFEDVDNNSYYTSTPSQYGRLKFYLEPTFTFYKWYYGNYYTKDTNKDEVVYIFKINPQDERVFPNAIDTIKRYYPAMPNVTADYINPVEVTELNVKVVGFDDIESVKYQEISSKIPEVVEDNYPLTITIPNNEEIVEKFEQGLFKGTIGFKFIYSIDVVSMKKNTIEIKTEYITDDATYKKLDSNNAQYITAEQCQKIIKNAVIKQEGKEKIEIKDKDIVEKYKTLLPLNTNTVSNIIIKNIEEADRYDKILAQGMGYGPEDIKPIKNFFKIAQEVYNVDDTKLTSQIGEKYYNTNEETTKKAIEGGFSFYGLGADVSAEQSESKKNEQSKILNNSTELNNFKKNHIITEQSGAKFVGINLQLLEFGTFKQNLTIISKFKYEEYTSPKSEQSAITKMFPTSVKEPTPTPTPVPPTPTPTPIPPTPTFTPIPPTPTFTPIPPTPTPVPPTPTPVPPTPIKRPSSIVK